MRKKIPITIYVDVATDNRLKVAANELCIPYQDYVRASLKFGERFLANYLSDRERGRVETVIQLLSTSSALLFTKLFAPVLKGTGAESFNEELQATFDEVLSEM